MTRARTYLDHNATSPLRPEARAAVEKALDVVGNPSSVHADGRAARQLVDDAREQVAALAGARPSEVVFTSGATEANNWVMRDGWDAILLSGIEHDAVLAPARASMARVVEVGTDRDGVADVGGFAAAILQEPDVRGRVLATLQMANNETGVIQPAGELADFCRAHGVSFHTDAVQAAGRVPLGFEAMGADTMALSSHKIGGPMGVGALIIRDGVSLGSLIAGGGQERRRRSGTENVPGIAGFGAAAERASAELADIGRISTLRDRLEAGLREISPAATIISAGADRLANTVGVAHPGITAETLVIKLDLAGISVSAGSACSSGKVGQSHVLMAMGLAPEIGRSTIRISLGWSTTEADIATFLNSWRALADGWQRAVA